MVKTIQAGIIGCNMSEDFFKTSESNRVENFLWKKIYLNDPPSSGLKNHQAEIVEQVEAIIHDADIELVFVSANHLQFVKPIIETGKSVRII